MPEDVAYVYLLRCRDGSLYCGWTTDLDGRVQTHNRGKGGAYTRSRLPVTLAGAWETPDRSTARRLEVQIKRRKRAGKEQLLAGATTLPEGAIRLDDGAAR